MRVGTHHVVKAYTPALKEDLPGEPVDKGKPELEDKQRDGNGEGGGLTSLRKQGYICLQ